MAGIISVVNAAFAIETFLEGLRTDEKRLGELMRNGELLVAESERGEILASVYTEVRGERGYFGMLAVDPSHQGAGIGRAMVKAAEDYCRQKGCARMDIIVLSLRPELLPYYRRLGYRETGREEFHPVRRLKEGLECECVTMSKDL